MRGRRNRRQTVTAIVIAAVVPTLMGLGAGACGGSGGASTATTSATADTETPVKGGTLTIGIDPPNILDPHFSDDGGAHKINAQVHAFLTRLNTNFEPTPDLALKWQSNEDATQWTFQIRPDVKFNTGDPLTVDDIVYSYNRMRDPEVGSMLVEMLSNVNSVTAPDSTHVVFDLKAPDPAFPTLTGDMRAAILSRKVKDPRSEWVSAGPFYIESQEPGVKIVLQRNPYYYGRDDDGNQLPYVDSIIGDASSDRGALVDGMLGGSIDVVQDIGVAESDRIAGKTGYQIIKGNGGQMYALHMRSDGNRVAADAKVRKALRIGTDYQGLIDLVRPGLAVVGNGTPVQPLYAFAYWVHTPAYDPEGAKKLLAETGQNDLHITLYVGDYSDMPEFAVAWQAQMAAIGVTVEIEKRPEDVYYGNGPNNFMASDYGLTTWSPKPTPLVFFKLTLVTGAMFNEGHWSDSEFDTLCEQIAVETDSAEATKLYNQAQEILWERGPYIVLGQPMTVIGASTKVHNIVPHPNPMQTLFEKVWKDE